MSTNDGPWSTDQLYPWEQWKLNQNTKILIEENNMKMLSAD